MVSGVQFTSRFQVWRSHARSVFTCARGDLWVKGLLWAVWG